MPTPGQLVVLFAAVALFTAGGAVSVARVWWPTRALRVAGKSCLYWGLTAAVAVLVWHGAAAHRWLPAGDNFDALVWLAVLLAGFTAYVQGTRPMAALDWFLMPVVVALLVAAAVLGRTDYQQYGGRATTYAHHLTSYAGAAAFAVAAAAGGMYLWASRRLRQHRPVAGYLPSLERLERLTTTSVTLGFALLTIGILTGLVEMVRHGMPTTRGKVALATCVWVVYAAVLHAPINPMFRGRLAARLSVVGFLLMVGAVVAAQFGGGRR
jgi:ABC-type uncharacterized transport system permease subunit